MSSFDNFIRLLLAVVLITGPTIGFLVWLVFRARKQKARGVALRLQIRSLIFTLTVAISGCILVALVSRALERGSESSFWVTVSMASAYAFYLFVLCSGTLLVVAAVAWGLMHFLVPKEPIQRATDNSGQSPVVSDHNRSAKISEEAC